MCSSSVWWIDFNGQMHFVWHHAPETKCKYKSSLWKRFNYLLLIMLLHNTSHHCRGICTCSTCDYYVTKCCNMSFTKPIDFNDNLKTLILQKLLLPSRLLWGWVLGVRNCILWQIHRTVTRGPMVTPSSSIWMISVSLRLYMKLWTQCLLLLWTFEKIQKVFFQICLYFHGAQFTWGKYI